MADLIENGYFEDDDLTPWERCVDNELGESWICLEEDEPAFPRMVWHYTREGSLTTANWIFLSEYNLRLTSNDGVRQTIGGGARASGDLMLWAHCTPIDQAAGELYAFVCYADRTFDYGTLTRAQLRRSCGPNTLHVAVRDKAIEKVVICVVGAEASWYVNAISLPAAESKALGHPSRPARRLEDRVALLEDRVERLVQLQARGPARAATVPGPRDTPVQEAVQEAWRKDG